jgi:hypothetical protein
MASAAPSQSTIKVTLELRDAAACLLDRIQWCPNGRGLTMPTKWAFTPGAELELGVCVGTNQHYVQGVVISCSEQADGFATTVYFIDPLPAEILETIGSTTKTGRLPPLEC